jgi:hypothetical protein
MTARMIQGVTSTRLKTRRTDDPSQCLHDASYAELRQMRCRLEKDRLILEGTVTSFYLKQIAQTILLQQWGKEIRVENRVEVHSRLERTDTRPDCDSTSTNESRNFFNQGG